jgi:gas vesicle protein
MSKSSKVLAAFVIGAAVGAAVGLLLAPEKGSETRRKLYEEGQRFADSVQEKVKEGKEKVESWKQKMSQRQTAEAGNGESL